MARKPTVVLDPNMFNEAHPAGPTAPRTKTSSRRANGEIVEHQWNPTTWRWMVCTVCGHWGYFDSRRHSCRGHAYGDSARPSHRSTRFRIIHPRHQHTITATWLAAGHTAVAALGPLELWVKRRRA